MMSRRSRARETASGTDVDSSTTLDASSSAVSRRNWSTLATVARWVRRIFSTVLVLALLAGLGVASYALVQGTWQINPVVSGSMRPGFAVGGVVISERIPVDQLAMRDVIVFKNPQQRSNLMVHRIVAMTKNKAGQLVIRTQGDANNVKDPWTLTISGRYAYVVRWSLPLLGYVSVAYQNHRGLVLLAAGAILLALASTTILKPRRRGGRRSTDDLEVSNLESDDLETHDLETHDLEAHDLEAHDPADSAPAKAGVGGIMTSYVAATSPDSTHARTRKQRRKKKSKG